MIFPKIGELYIFSKIRSSPYKDYYEADYIALDDNKNEYEFNIGDWFLFIGRRTSAYSEYDYLFLTKHGVIIENSVCIHNMLEEKNLIENNLNEK